MRGMTKRSTNVPNAGPRGGRRGRFTDLTLDELKRLFVEKIGRESGSSDRRYVELASMESSASRDVFFLGGTRPKTPHNRTVAVE